MSSPNERIWDSQRIWVSHRIKKKNMTFTNCKNLSFTKNMSFTNGKNELHKGNSHKNIPSRITDDSCWWQIAKESLIHHADSFHNTPSSRTWNQIRKGRQNWEIKSRSILQISQIFHTKLSLKYYLLTHSILHTYRSMEDNV